MATIDKARRYVTGTALVLILGLGIAGGRFVLRTHTNARTASGSTLATARRAQPRPDPQDPFAAATHSPWSPGVRRIYAAEFSSTFEGDKRATDGSLTLAGSATLSLVATSSDPERVVLQGTLTDVSLVADTPGSEPKHIESSVGAEISKPFVLTISAGGAIETLAVDRTVQGLGFNILRTLIASLQFVEPTDPRPDPTAWVTQETDQNGRYNAHYRQVDEAHFEKRKEYTFLDIAAKLQLDKRMPAPSVSSVASITRSQPGILQSVQTRDSMDVPLGQGNSFHSESSIAITLDQEGAGDALAIDTSQLVAAPLFENRALDTRSEKAQRDKALVGHASLSELWAALDALPPTSENREARWTVTQRMTALFNTDPASIDMAVLKLRGSLKPGDGEVLLAALSDASVPQAQAALTRIAQDAGIPDDVRQAAITQLSLNDHPNADTLSELNRMAQDPADPDRRAAATLALGGAARRSSQDASLGGESGPAVGHLVDGFKAASTPDEQALYLAALGNSASPKGLDSIKAGLASSVPNVRAVAVGALRSIDGPAADALIIAVLASDPDPTVRGAAVQAMRTRPITPELGAALATAAHTDRAETVRLKIVRLLADRISESSDLAALLAWIAQHDADPDVKNAAATALNNGVVVAQGAGAARP